MSPLRQEVPMPVTGVTDTAIALDYRLRTLPAPRPAVDEWASENPHTIPMSLAERGEALDLLEEVGICIGMLAPEVRGLLRTLIYARNESSRVVLNWLRGVMAP